MKKILVLAIAVITGVSAALYIAKGNSERDAALNAAMECKMMIEGIGRAITMETKLNVDMSEFNKIKAGCLAEDMRRLRQFTDKDNLGLRRELIKKPSTLIEYLYVSALPDGFMRINYNDEIKLKPVLSLNTKDGEILGYVQYSISNGSRMGVVIQLENQTNIRQRLALEEIDFDSPEVLSDGFKSNYGEIVSAVLIPVNGNFNPYSKPGYTGMLFLETNI